MSEQNKALLRRFYQEVMEKGNIAAVDQFVDPKYVEHNPVPGQAPGIEGLKQVFTMFLAAFANPRITVEDMVAEGDKVVSRYTGRATHKGEFMGIAPTGKEVTFNGIEIARIAGGKLVEHWEIMDMSGLMQ